MTQQGLARTRRIGWLLAAPAAGALVLAGCSGGTGGGGTENGGSGGDSGSFTFSYPVSSNIESPYEILANTYQEENDGVSIELNAVPNDQFGSTIRTQLQAGNAPDLFYVTPGSGQESSALPLAEAGYLEPITNEASQALVEEAFQPLFTLDGEQFLQPVDIVPVGMIFNATAGEESGVEWPESTEALIDECAPLTDAGKSFIALAGSAPPNTGLMALTISASRVYAEDPQWDQKRLDGEVTFADSEGWQETLQTIVDLKDAGCFQPGVEGGGFDVITNGITQGTSLSAFAPSGAAADLMRATPDLTIRVEMFPPAEGGRQFTFASPNNALAVNAAGENKQAALDFLEWLADPAQAVEFASVSGNVPVTGIADAELPEQYAPVQELLASGEYSALPNLNWPNPSVYDALGSGVQGLLTGQTSVDDLLASMDAAWDN